ncbi:hypothetical protein TanjilG_01645 [Lupinus angustifolius]|uniref:Peptidase A1 domain-containing protein n=1 Tax=Lupinus angustifolius TaxID=3871 RepID=A0A1J7GV73_LUPAN|nr:hypothetical protein TanjilG_01645 [Lupinus angustifolius]
MTRQKMRLGSQYESLYPSEGSKTFSFGNVLDWLHYTWIDIGTPNISFLVALDTGSDLLWVPCDCIECASLSAGHYNVLDRDLNEYSPSLSSTSRHLPCSHQLCDLSSECKGPKDPCPYKDQYASDNTSSSGFLIEDKLHLASDGRNAAQSSVQASIILGCGRKQSGGYLDGAAPDGLLGLGPGSISVPSLLAKAGLIPNSFSICLNENDSGRILFGDQGHIDQQSTPFLPVEGRFSQELNNIPRMKFTFSKNQTFLIQNPLLTFPVSQEYTAFCLTVIQTDEDYGTIGQDFLKGYRMVFDRENLRFGWIKFGTSDSRQELLNFEDMERINELENLNFQDEESLFDGFLNGNVQDSLESIVAGNNQTQTTEFAAYGNNQTQTTESATYGNLVAPPLLFDDSHPLPWSPNSSDPLSKEALQDLPSSMVGLFSEGAAYQSQYEIPNMPMNPMGTRIEQVAPMLPNTIAPQFGRATMTSPSSW